MSRSSIWVMPRVPSFPRHHEHDEQEPPPLLHPTPLDDEENFSERIPSYGSQHSVTHLGALRDLTNTQSFSSH